MKNDKEFLEFILKALVNNPDDVKVERTTDEMGVLMTVSVNPEDMGKVIGVSGNTAKSVRTLMRVIGMKNNARINMKILEPGASSGLIPRAFNRDGEDEDNEY